ncbi:hypothetical protein DFP72DRAFT_1091967 [Ephemerocybe angulata]|uniref:Uncharacterized protein n=1 Tax=Ephemerocybe angulata TaxID=980116 RepID=A0A8H6M9D3_9AGAR|nr:hypothetical protein DFP72DRAFT_1091967 [Tulosesus angulatus]
MPEYRECIGHGQTGLWYLEKLQQIQPLGCRLLDLWGDLTVAEDSFIQHVIPFRYEKSKKKPNTYLRGKSGAQTSVFPTEVLRTGILVKDLNLVLEEVRYDGRAIYLCFDGMTYLKLSFLTHTSMQLYSRRLWESSVVRSQKRDHRGFKVGLALEFPDFFWSFNTFDLVFQPEWVVLGPVDMCILDSRSRYKLGRDVYLEYHKFILDLVRWRKSRRMHGGDRDGLAWKVIRSKVGKPWARDVFHGVGVYTASEIFFKAGLRINLTEAEVFDDPSRTARLCEAFWTWAFQSQNVFKCVIKPAIDKPTGLIAPDQKKRLRVVTELDVFGKDTTTVPPRMLQASGKDNRYDTFEPTFIADALEAKNELKPYGLSALVFGLEESQKLFPNAPLPTDPLTQAFISERKWSATWRPKTLDLQVYYKRDEGARGSVIILRDPTPVRQWKKAYVYLYKCKKQMWTIIPLDPSKLGDKVTWALEAERRRLLFTNIVKNTKGVAIGVLEYVGHAMVLNTPHGTVAISVIGDPTLSEYLCAQSIWHRFSGKGDHKVKLSKAEKAALQDKVSEIKAFAGLTSQSTPMPENPKKRKCDDSTSNEPPSASLALERMRFHADQRLQRATVRDFGCIPTTIPDFLEPLKWMNTHTPACKSNLERRVAGNRPLHATHSTLENADPAVAQHKPSSLAAQHLVTEGGRMCRIEVSTLYQPLAITENHLPVLSEARAAQWISAQPIEPSEKDRCRSSPWPPAFGLSTPHPNAANLAPGFPWSGYPGFGGPAPHPAPPIIGWGFNAPSGYSTGGSNNTPALSWGAQMPPSQEEDIHHGARLAVGEVLKEVVRLSIPVALRPKPPTPCEDGRSILLPKHIPVLMRSGDDVDHKRARRQRFTVSLLPCAAMPHDPMDGEEALRLDADGWLPSGGWNRSHSPDILQKLTGPPSLDKPAAAVTLAPVFHTLHPPAPSNLASLIIQLFAHRFYFGPDPRREAMTSGTSTPKAALKHYSGFPFSPTLCPLTRTPEASSMPGDERGHSDEYDLEESEEEWQGPGSAMYHDYRRNHRSPFLVAHLTQREEAAKKEMGEGDGAVEVLMERLNVFVDAEDHTKITSVIDWESTTTRPLWASAHVLACFQQSSPFVSKLFRKAIAELPSRADSNFRIPSPPTQRHKTVDPTQLCNELYYEAASAWVRMGHWCAEWGLEESIIGLEELEPEWFKAGTGV